MGQSGQKTTRGINNLAKSNFITRSRTGILKYYEFYLFLLPTLLYFAIFHYAPMYGIIIAFKDFIAVKGMWGSPWVGLKHFERFINGYQFWTLFKNTLGLSAYQLIAGFPMPILMALIVNQVTNMKVKKTVQTITYAPHFISTVVLVGMLFTFLSPRSGFINKIIAAFGGEPIFFMASAQWFKTLYVLSGIWQNAGWGMIIYLAALSNVDTGLYDAAMIDGANRFQRVIHIDIPSIIPTAIMLLILNMGRVMSVGFEKAFLMQTPANLESAEIISTYVYKVGLLNAQFSFSTAVGLFNSVINLILIIVVNSLARKYSETSLW